MNMKSCGWLLAVVVFVSPTRTLEAQQPAVWNKVARFPTPIFHPSGLATLLDGRVLVVEDKAYHAIDVIDLRDMKIIHEATPNEIKVSFEHAGTAKLSEIEGATADGRGHIYAITSYSLDKKGMRESDREQLVRFDVAGIRLQRGFAFSKLRGPLGRLSPIIKDAAEHKTGKGRGLNIEGLAWDPATSSLLIGLRAPLADGNALVIRLVNPDAVLERHEAPQMSKPILLDMGGEGIRDMTYDPRLHGFVLIAGPSGKTGDERGRFDLWLWSGRDTDAPAKLAIPQLNDLKAEGVTIASVGGREALFFVSDDGAPDKNHAKGKTPQDTGKAANYLLLDLNLLRTQNPQMPQERAHE